MPFLSRAYLSWTGPKGVSAVTLAGAIHYEPGAPEPEREHLKAPLVVLPAGAFQAAAGAAAVLESHEPTQKKFQRHVYNLGDCFCAA